MPGRHVTDLQMRLYVQFRQTDPRRAAASKARFSPATADRIEQDRRLPSLKKAPRGRRRPDPLAKIFQAEVVPLLQASPGLRPIALFEEMVRRHPELDAGVRRTLERRIRSWRALHDAEQEVIFRQNHDRADRPVGLQRHECRRHHRRRDRARSPTLPLPARLSGFEHAHVVLGGESFVALAEGMQNALWSLGGAPGEHRTDSLSAAFRNLDADASADLTRRYEALCAHYGMTPTRNNAGIAHENGAVEGPHGHLKRAIADALLLRASAEFPDLAAYRRFLDELVGRRIARNAPADRQRAGLAEGVAQASELRLRGAIVHVTSSGGFTLCKVFYTVPSRLIGHRLRVRLYVDRLALFLGGAPLLELLRGRVHPDDRHDQVVNYRHVIHALRRKPMALLNIVYRDRLFPRDTYRHAFDALFEAGLERQSCRVMVELLSLAHERGCEAELGLRLAADLEARRLPDLAALRAAIPHVTVHLAKLASYKRLLGSTVQ